MDNVPFVTNETPHVLWDVNLKQTNLDFLNSIDCDYFSYVAEINTANIDKVNQHKAALSLLVGYSQGLETLFSLLCAAIQAPLGVAGWMVSYTNSDLRELVYKILHSQKIYTMLRGNPITWDLMAKYVHSYLSYEKEKLDGVQKEFGILWSRFADDFLDKNIYREYVSVKHGTRVRPGGVALAVGLEDIPGQQASSTLSVLS